MSRPRNDLFLRALLKEPTETTPVWLMRQAGRYLPEYRETRKRAGSFLGLCKNPAYACEVTLQPLARYDLDAAILFSDILTVPDAMGLGLYFSEGEGPKFERPLRDEWEIRNLCVPDPHDQLRYVIDAVAEIRKALDNTVPLIGFSGSPWTLACYMVEGGASDDYARIKTMAYDRPDLMHKILDVTTESVIQYLNAQIEAGAQAVMIFDSWGGVLADGAAGRLVPVGDSDALAVALIGVLDNPAAQQRYVAAAAEAVQRYDWSVVADQIIRVYETVAGAGVKAEGRAEVGRGLRFACAAVIARLTVTARPWMASVSASAIAAAVLAATLEGAHTVAGGLRLLLAVAAGRRTVSGTTHNYRDLGNTKNRVVSTVDSSGNRAAASTADGT